jgi:ER membrane protein complex subunit 6
MQAPGAGAVGPEAHAFSMTHYVPERIGLNTAALGQVFTLSALASGVAAGIIGLTGVLGFAFFGACQATTMLMLATFFLKGKPENYFCNGKAELLRVGNLLQGLLTFILTWTIAYDSVYIFTEPVLSRR